MKQVYRDDVDVYVKNCSEQARNRIAVIQKTCEKKKLTEAGRERLAPCIRVIDYSYNIYV